MAEGNYPFPSTYITFSLLPGHPTPLPAWPMRVACSDSGLNNDLGIHLTGSMRDVKYTVKMGDIEVHVDWQNATGNGAELTEDQIKRSGVLTLASAVADAAGVWFNLTKDKKCFDIEPQWPPNTTDTPRHPPIAPERHARVERILRSGGHAPTCPTCPPCDDCPPCPVSYCDWEDQAPCDYPVNEMLFVCLVFFIFYAC